VLRDTKTKDLIKSAALTFKDDVSAFAETAFIVNAAYFGSIGNYL
jgi:hypothetical protein